MYAEPDAGAQRHVRLFALDECVLGRWEPSSAEADLLLEHYGEHGPERDGLTRRLSARHAVIRRINGLGSVDEVQSTILAASYCVIGLGDVYLGAPVALPLDPRHQLVTTKYTPPRTWTPENAVGIGGSFLCIYGMEGPGGYQLFGRTVQVWNRAAAVGRVTAPGRVDGEPPWLLRHFDRIRFELVDEPTLARLRDAASAGRSVVSITEGTLRLADRLALEREHAAEIATIRAQRAAAFDSERERWNA